MKYQKHSKEFKSRIALETIIPKRNLSKSNKQHKKYPYLLRGVNITHPNHVWSTDITYIKLARGYVYLVAIIDWYSRKVLSWRFDSIPELRNSLKDYFKDYNEKREHQSLDYLTLDEVYYNKRVVKVAWKIYTLVKTKLS